MDVIPQVHLLLPVELESRARDMEAATYCTLLTLRGSAIVTRMQSASRAHDELVTSQPSVEGGSPHIWFITAMAEGNRERRGLSGPRRRVLRPRERVERVARWPRKAKKTHGQAWAWTMLKKPCQKINVLKKTQLQTALLGKTRKNEDCQTWSSSQKRIPRQG